MSGGVTTNLEGIRGAAESKGRRGAGTKVWQEAGRGAEWRDKIFSIMTLLMGLNIDNILSCHIFKELCILSCPWSLISSQCVVTYRSYFHFGL